MVKYAIRVLVPYGSAGKSAISLMDDMHFAKLRVDISKSVCVWMHAPCGLWAKEVEAKTQ